MIANPECLPLVKGFRVLHQEGFQVHSVLQIKIEATQVVTAYQEPKKPKSIYELLRHKSWLEWQEQEFEERKNTTEEDLPEKVWETTKLTFHARLDDDLKRKDGTFAYLLRKGDSTEYWKYWSSTFENSLLDFCGVQLSDAKPYKGRGASIRKGVTTKGTPKKDDQKQRSHAAKLPLDVAKLVKQEGRCQAWADRLSAVEKRGLKKDQERKFEVLNKAESKKVLENINGR